MAATASRANHPTVSHDEARGTTPSSGTAPQLGRMPHTPQNAAGMRTEPAVSVPTAKSASPAATATADPEDEPPGSRSGPPPDHGVLPSAPASTAWVAASLGATGAGGAAVGLTSRLFERELASILHESGARFAWCTLETAPLLERLGGPLHAAGLHQAERVRIGHAPEHVLHAGIHRAGVSAGIVQESHDLAPSGRRIPRTADRGMVSA